MYEKVAGQKKALAHLQSDLDSGRLAESYLFAGPESVGKRLAALEFAKAINCASARRESLIPDRSTTTVPCGECASCRKADSGAHPEIFILDFKSQAELLNLEEDQEIK